MKNLIFENYQKTVSNHLRLKTLEKKNSINQFFKTFNISMFHFKLDSFKNINVIESLYLFKLIYRQKSYISYFKKKYKEYDLIISLNMSKKSFVYFLSIWLILIYPVLNRRNISFKKKILEQGTIVFNQSLFNIYPFIPNIYFSLFKVLSHEVSFLQKNKATTFLLGNYYNIIKGSGKMK